MASKAPLVLSHTDLDGVAVVAINRPPVNALTVEVMESLQDALESAQSSPSCRAIVLTGTHGRFCAGLDVVEVFVNTAGRAGGLKGLGEQHERVNAVLTSLLESGPKPTVAAIERVALGGGCELALACNARVATSNAVLGLPELRFGIIPDFGGVQRLPRVVGAPRALDMMLTASPVKGEQALNIGLVDELVESPEQLLPAAKRVALELAEGRRGRRRALQAHEGDAAWREEALSAARAARRRRLPWGIPPLAAYVCIDAVEEGVRHGPLAGMTKSQRGVALLGDSAAHKAFVRAFAAHHAARHAAGLRRVLLSAVALLLRLWVFVVLAAGRAAWAAGLRAQPLRKKQQ